MKKSFMLTLFAFSAVFTISSIALEQQKPDAQFQQTAESWLALVDSGRYAQSWDAASQEFKAKLTKDRWEAMLKQVRAPLGKEESRTFKLAKAAKNPPNSPPGEYEILQYSTAYQKMPSANEVVALVEEKDGQWRVVEYSINLPSKRN